MGLGLGVADWIARGLGGLGLHVDGGGVAGWFEGAWQCCMGAVGWPPPALNAHRAHIQQGSDSLLAAMMAATWEDSR